MVLGALLSSTLFASGQPAVIPVHISNLAKPGDLDFEGGECERRQDSMTCTFQQVLLNQAGIPQDTCQIITNRYDLTFKSQGSGRWISREGPTGACGVVETTTLQEEPQGRGILWTMDSQKVITNRTSDACKSLADEPAEHLTWRDPKRALPCRFIIPGVVQ
jgi:hypothetical protein